MKRYLVIGSVSKSSFLEEQNFPCKEAQCVLYRHREALSLHVFLSLLLSLFSMDLNFTPFRKDWHLKEPRWEAEESLRVGPLTHQGIRPASLHPLFLSPASVGAA